MSSEHLEQGIALSRAGKQAEARELFAQLIAADVHDEIAWVWYASTLTTREDMAKALEECLHHNPDCAEAARRLAVVTASPPTPIQETDEGAGMEAAMMAATKQCLYCAETIKAAAKVCRYCGKDIATETVIAAEKPQEEKRSSGKSCLLVAASGLLVTCVLCGWSGGLFGDSSASDATPAARATSQATARDAPVQGSEPAATGTTRGDSYQTRAARATSQATAHDAPIQSPELAPTSTTRDYTYWQIERNHETMTDAQWELFTRSIVGGRVRWTAEVIEISENTLHLDMGSEQPARVYLHGGASALQNDVVEGQFIEFEAIIRRVDRVSGLAIRLAEPVILVENVPTPTATPTLVPAGMVTVVSENGNLRAGPGTNYEIVGSAQKGDELPVYARTDDGSWYQIDWAGHSWIAAGIVEPSQDVLGVPIAPSQTPTPVPTETPTPVSNLILSVPMILGRSVSQVEAIAGSPFDIVPFDSDTPELEGGASRYYDIGKYSVFVDFDRNGVARGFQVWDGLDGDRYSLNEWRTLLPRFGLAVTTPPDRVAGAAMYWNDYQGYKITIAASSSSGRPVWTVQIWDADFFGP